MHLYLGDPLHRNGLLLANTPPSLSGVGVQDLRPTQAKPAMDPRAGACKVPGSGPPIAMGRALACGAVGRVCQQMLVLPSEWWAASRMGRTD